MLLIVVLFKVKEPLFVPESAAVNAPVGWFPVLFTVTGRAVWAP
jgi:hypothetical protein